MKSTYRDIVELEKIKEIFNKYDEFIVYDLETSGLNSITDLILQFNGKKYNKNFELIDSLNVFIKTPPEIKINGTIVSQINHITDELLEEKGVSNEEAFKLISNFIDDNCLLLGYNNQRFDDNYMINFYLRNEKAFKFGDEIDVFLLAKKIISSNEPKIQKESVTKTGRVQKKASYKLENITNYFEIGKELRFHDADSDVEATAFVFKNLMRLIDTEIDSFYNTKNELKDVEKQDVEILSFKIFNPSMKIRRIYFNTTGGSIYYDDIGNNWGVKDGNINSYNMDKFISDVKKKFNITDTEDLFKAVKKIS